MSFKLQSGDEVPIDEITLMAEIAEDWAQKRSQDPKTKVGAAIMECGGSENVVFECNHFHNYSKEFPLNGTCYGEYEYLNSKHPYIIHAEMNVIMHAILKEKITDFSRCLLFVTHHPCGECAKLIITCGIKDIIYRDELNEDSDSTIAAKKLFEAYGVKLHKLSDIA